MSRSDDLDRPWDSLQQQRRFLNWMLHWILADCFNLSLYEESVHNLDERRQEYPLPLGMKVSFYLVEQYNNPVGWDILAVGTAFLLGRTVPKQANPLSVNVTFRKAIMGAGYVVQFHNNSGKSLPLKITVTNPTFNKTKTFDAVANPGAVPLEIGHLEGWTFASGDLIEVVSDGYDPLNVKIP